MLIPISVTRKLYLLLLLNPEEGREEEEEESLFEAVCPVIALQLMVFMLVTR